MLDDLHLFIEIARRNSMSQAAKDLGLNLSTLSRRMQGLEEKLAEPLLQRTARAIIATHSQRHCAYHKRRAALLRTCRASADTQ